ncbi:MAG TPA: hypothetical protein EYQ00_09200 [Dehalococcoidia bacterium]|nr:hypothetical protein [Dehalococcoidia bacterium]
MSGQSQSKYLLFAISCLLLVGLVCILFSGGLIIRSAVFATAAAAFMIVPISHARGELKSIAGSKLERDQLEAFAYLSDLESLTPVVFSKLIEPMQEGIIIVKGSADDGEVFVANSAAAQMLDRDRSQMSGTSLIRASLDASLLEVARRSDGISQEVALPGGRILKVSSTRLSHPNFMTHKSEEAVEGLVLSLQDLTDRRLAERSRSELIANVSHDLRTPITAGRLLAETIEAGVSDEKLRKKFHRSLLGELNRLSRMVERLVRLSRIESHEDEFAILAFPVEELIVTVIDNMATISAASGISLVQSEGAKIFLASDPQMSGDFDRLLEVFINLIDNAISVSPRNSSIGINAFATDVINSQEEITFEVIDHGPGIPPSDRTRIFERFYTGEVSRNSQNEGLGLGLSIARHIVQRHGGEISVRNGIAGGAVFIFTIPIGVPAGKDG